MLILAIDDFASPVGPIYAKVASVHAVSALTARLMSGAVVVALVYLTPARATPAGASLSLLALYLINAAIQFRQGK